MNKNRFNILTAALAVVLCLPLASWGIMDDRDFISLCKNGTADLVQTALEEGANVNAKDENDYTPLMAATDFNKNPEVISVLLKAGAEVNAVDAEGYTPLMGAVTRNTPESVSLLLEAGADVNIKVKNGVFKGSTALVAAAWLNKTPEVISMLLNAGADVNVKVSDGVFKGATALMAAAAENTPEIVSMLLKAGADVSAVDGEGKTARDYARKTGNKEIVQLLEEVERSKK